MKLLSALGRRQNAPTFSWVSQDRGAGMAEQIGRVWVCIPTYRLRFTPAIPNIQRLIPKFQQKRSNWSRLRLLLLDELQGSAALSCFHGEPKTSKKAWGGRGGGGHFSSASEPEQEAEHEEHENAVIIHVLHQSSRPDPSSLMAQRRGVKHRYGG